MQESLADPIPLARAPAGADAPAPDQLALLDAQEEWQAFSRSLAGSRGADAAAGRWESTVALEGMHCAACAGTIEQVLRGVPGVLEVEVSAAARRGRVVWDERRTRPSRWIGALAGTGYRALPAHDVAASAQRQADTRRMLWRLGVAGLCMMQVMMYAAPVYFSAPGEIAPDLVHLLRWAQWVLSVPVVLFSCRPFFAGAWRDLRLRRISMDLPVALGMAITFVVSSLGTFEPDGMFGREVYFDSLTMFVFFLLTGRWLELRLRDRSAGALEALMHRLPDSIERATASGAWERVALRRLRVGDRLRVLPGAAFPADGEILAGQTAVDEALLTGESRPVARGVGEAVVAGSHNLGAPVEMRVRALGEDTRYAQIVALMERVALDKPRLAQLADRLATPFLVGVLLAALLAGLWWWPRDPGQAVMVAVAVLVVTCPCALSLATPAAMLASAGALARRGVLVRRLQAIEALAAVDTVVFDKTGTLTRDAFVLTRTTVRDGVTPEQALALAAALARHSLHPVSRALVAAQGPDARPEPVVEAVREHAGEGLAAELVRDGQRVPLRLGSAAFCGVPPRPADGPVSHLADDQGWLASFELHEDLRADAAVAVATLRAQGVRVALLSGDQAQAVRHAGGRAGIDEVLGACSPDDKLAWLQAAQRAGARVAMVGDGLNDGPVLAAAEVSFAFGRAVPLAQGRSDFVVLDERLGTIARTRTQAMRTLRVVRQNLGWAMAYNLVGIPLAMSSWMSAWAAGLGMAASSLLVVLNALRLNTAPQPENP
ncbi:MAG TPA: cation-translocating P-type ATPase [Ottowia sp.]|uniref:heavy metal translocating P-type ATPase n=1 Tax=Ottowia sp. TaxID=1898956 RepID=UPI002CF6F300|nr:cation-translocating P-type ATPase [Ottowia sp.]HMN21873.1 cation-translocating P-type ATPase [Ottowia sp.]